jgi:lysophospholipase L1-like esterase
MEWYEAEVRQIESARSVRNIPTDPVVFYGSSSIRLWENLAGDLGSPRAVNVGFGGSTLEACAYFFERLVLPLQPCSLVVYAGDNDLGDGRSPRQVLSFYRALSSKVEKRLPGVPFAFLSIKPSPAREPLLNRIRRTNSLIRHEMETRECGLFVNIFDPMLDAKEKPRPELFSPDGLHMGPDGYRVWAEVLTPYRHRIFVEDCSSLQTRPLSLP